MNQYQPMRDKDTEHHSKVNNRNSVAVGCSEQALSSHNVNTQRSSSVNDTTSSAQYHNHHDSHLNRPPLFGSLLAAQKFTRNHPYLRSADKPGCSASLFHSQQTRMGNHHGKVMVDGEQYVNNKAQQVFTQLRNQLEFSKV